VQNFKFKHFFEQMYYSIGVVEYGPGLKVVAIIDQGIVDFYRNLIPKYYNVNPQKHKAHITIVRENKESPKNMEFWGKYQNKKIDFFYDNKTQTDGVYFWLDAFSEDIGRIREELGLSKFRDDREFGGKLRSAYHITIANTKT